MLVVASTVLLWLCIGDQVRTVLVLLLVVLLPLVRRRFLFLHDRKVGELEVAEGLWGQMAYKSVTAEKSPSCLRPITAAVSPSTCGAWLTAARNSTAPAANF